MKKNIVIVVSAMNMGGAQRVVSILCNHWSQSGYAVTLISTFTQKKINHFQLHKDVNLKYLSNNPFFPSNNTFNVLWKFIQLRKLIKNINPRVVISFLARINVASALATFGTKSYSIICERTWPPFASLDKRLFWMYRLLFKGVKKIVVQTEKSKTWLSKNLPNKDVAVIPNPVLYPLPEHGRSASPESVILKNKKIILASGRLHKVKQFDLLIKAFSNIKDNHPNWDLVILGDGEEKNNLNQLVCNLELVDRVFFPGKVGNMSQWYDRANIFVLSSVVEGFPNVLLEAMSHGLPSISFDCNTGPRDMIKDGLNGILVNPEKRDLGLENAMKELITNQALRKKFSQNSILLRDEYSKRNIMKKWDKAISL